MFSNKTTVEPSLRKYPLIAATIALTALSQVPSASAHHSFAPHFDTSKPVQISGQIVEYEQRNPHAYLHIAATDENGRTRTYICESHGVTQLTRNGISPSMLAVGTQVTVTGSQARRDPYMCFFQTVALSDGRVLNVNGGSAAESLIAEEQRDSIVGNWLLVPANRSTSGPQPMMAALTEAGRQAAETYDPFVDDPTYRCDPVAIRRVWFAPGTPLSISRDQDTIRLNFEWMDAERTVHLNQTAHPQDGARTSLGHSIGYFEDDTLVIETANYSAGVLRQYVEMPGQPTRGMPHSAELTTTERIRLDKDTNRLIVSIDHHDPAYFAREFETVTAQYAPTALELEPFGCRPENADHSLVSP